MKDCFFAALIDTGSYRALAQQAAARLAQAQTAAPNAEGELRRQFAVETIGIASPADLDTVRANVAASVATAAVAQLNLDRLHALAPFDGAVAERWVTQRDFMENGKPMTLRRTTRESKAELSLRTPGR